MASIKVTVFQKNLNSEITKEQKQRIIAQKSDFLLLPEFYPFTAQNQSLVNLASNYKKYSDNLVEISCSYRGAIIGGSIIREEKGKFYNSSPIISDGVEIDSYDQKKVSPKADAGIQSGNSEGIFILKGIRFAIALGNEIRDEEYLAQLKNDDIQYIFNLSSDMEHNMAYEEELAYFAELAKKYDIYIFRCCGTGSLYNTELKGRSLFASPAGINWKVASTEEDKDIIKTINLNI